MRVQLRAQRWASWIGLSLCLGLSLLTACGDGTTVTPASSPTAVSLVISPLTVTVTQGESRTFSVTVTGLSNTAVKWSIQEGAVGGSITSAGVYTAPTTAIGKFHVVATSIADATLTAVAAVDVEPPPTTAPAAGTFTAVGSMNTARSNHTATLLGNGKVLIAGGWDGSRILGSAELYDPVTRTFVSTGSMVTPRYGHSATLLADGRVLIAGGISSRPDDPNRTFVFAAEIYDPSTGVFMATGDMSSLSGGLSTFYSESKTTLIPDGRVFLAGLDNGEIYDPHSGTFALAGPYAQQPGSWITSTATLLTTGKVLISGFGQGLTELFDPQSGTFSVTGPMTYKFFPDYGYSATLLVDGRVFFVGTDEFAGANAEIYDPASGTFASGGSDLWAQDLYPAVARLTDGRVLIAGGGLFGGNGSTNARLYVPASGAFQFAGFLTTGRNSHTATALPDNTVLLTGGYSVWTWPNPQPTPTAEVYKPN